MVKEIADGSACRTDLSSGHADGCSEKPSPAQRRRCGELPQDRGDKADEWQKANSQYFVIGWRCEKKKT
jgi:hypothetical protein